MGRKTSTDDVITRHWSKIKECLVLGVEHKEIYKALGVSRASYFEFMKKNPELMDSVKVARANDIEGRLEELARGRGLCNELMDNAMKLTRKHELKTTKKYVKKDVETGKETEHREVTIREVDPNAGMLQLMLQNYFKGWSANKELFALRERELALREKIAEDNF